MAQLTVTTVITYDDASATDVRDTLCLAWGYYAGSGQTKVQFIQSQVDSRVAEFTKNLISDTFTNQKQKQITKLQVS